MHEKTMIFYCHCKPFSEGLFPNYLHEGGAKAGSTLYDVTDSVEIK